MKTIALMFRSACVAALGSLVVSSAYGKSMQPIQMETGSGLEIEVACDFDNQPPSGVAPLHITVHNNSSHTGTWQFESNSNGYQTNVRSSLRIPVRPGESRTVPMMAPLNVTSGSFWIHATGPGVSMENVYFSQNSTGGGPSSQFLAMSRELVARSWEPLKKKVEAAKRSYRATQFDAPDLAADWRAFSGVEWLALTEQEWTKLAPDVRSAIRQWVAGGGHLVVVAGDATKLEWSDFHLASQSGTLAYGFGDVRAIAWDGKELSPDVLAPLITSGGSQSDRLNNPEGKGWPMLSALGDLKPNQPLILGFVIVFAALVGPVNLFYFAPAARRHRMFWTTPLLSLGGSVLLIAVIVLQEGVGGTGRRFTLIRLLPEAHEAVVLQDQVSRTGLLMGSAFRMNEDAFAVQVPLDGKGNGDKGLAIEARTYSGDWFKSRSIQAQRFACVRPTRAALTVVGLAPSGAPIVVSSIESTLETVVVTDEQGTPWRGDNIRTGEKVTLKDADRKVCNDWWNDTIRPARSSMGEGLRAASRTPDTSFFGNPGTFFATVAQSKGEPIATLPSIRWKEDRVVYTGQVTQMTQMAAAKTGATQP